MYVNVTPKQFYKAKVLLLQEGMRPDVDISYDLLTLLAEAHANNGGDFDFDRAMRGTVELRVIKT